MLTSYICPDGILVDVLGCLAQCRMARRCLSLPTLREVARQRPWTGKPSVTQLLNGTMLEFLKLTTDYAIRPESRAFALLGTQHHAHLSDQATDDDAISELSFQGGAYTGQPDFYQDEELWDYKTWGSYRVARFLGMVAEKIDDPMGARYEKSGSWGRAGSIKQVTTWRENSLVADTHDIDLQLNAYRLMLERNGLPVKAMRVQITVRDGGLAVARQRGIEWLMRAFDVSRLPDDEVEDYFGAKGRALEAAMILGSHNKICSPDERWDDMRCREYCDVALACPHGREVKQEIT